MGRSPAWLVVVVVPLAVLGLYVGSYAWLRATGVLELCRTFAVWPAPARVGGPQPVMHAFSPAIAIEERVRARIEGMPSPR